MKASELHTELERHLKQAPRRPLWFALVACSVLLLAGCGGSAATCDSDCQDARAMDQRIADQSAGIAEQQDEAANISETLDIEAKILTEAQQRAEIMKVITYHECVTVDVIDAGAAAVHTCYAQLLASGFGAVR